MHSLIETQTGWSIKRFVRTARRFRTIDIRTIDIRAGGRILAAEDPAAEDPLPNDLRDALAMIT